MKKPSFIKTLVWTFIVCASLSLAGGSMNGTLPAYWRMAKVGFTGPLFNYLFFGIPVTSLIVAGLIYGVVFLIWKLRRKSAKAKA